MIRCNLEDTERTITMPGQTDLLFIQEKSGKIEKRLEMEDIIEEGSHCQTSIKVESAWEPPQKCLGKRVFCNNHVVATKQRKLQ